MYNNLSPFPRVSVGKIFDERELKSLRDPSHPISILLFPFPFLDRAKKVVAGVAVSFGVWPEEGKWVQCSSEL